MGQAQRRGGRDFGSFGGGGGGGTVHNAPPIRLPARPPPPPTNQPKEQHACPPSPRLGPRPHLQERDQVLTLWAEKSEAVEEAGGLQDGTLVQEVATGGAGGGGRGRGVSGHEG